MSKRQIIIVLLFFSSINLFSQDYEWKIFTYEDSLNHVPSKGVRDILITSLGDVIISTSKGYANGYNSNAGLFKYNHQNWDTLFIGSNSDYPSSTDYIWGFIEDQHGVIWVATEGGLLKIDKMNSVLLTKSNSELPTNTLQDILIDSNNSLWMASYDKGLIKYSDGIWQFYDTNNSNIANNNILDIALDRNGKVWLGSNGSLSMFDNESFVNYFSNDSLNLEYISSISFDNSNNVWCSSYYSSFISNFDGENWKTYNFRQILNRNSNYNSFEIIFDNDGRLFAVGPYGVAIFNNHTWNFIDSKNSNLIEVFPNNLSIGCISIDKLNNMWVGTSYGFATLNIDLISGVSLTNYTPRKMEFSLNQNYPNPFNPSTKISYSIPEEGKVKLTVFDILGRKIQTLVNEELSAGSYEVEFNTSASSATAKSFSSGVYFYRLQVSPSSGSGQGFVETKKMLLLR